LNLSPIYPASDDPQDVAKAKLDDGLILRLYMDALFKGVYPQDVIAHLGADAPQVQSGPVAGWYADPITPKQERFWNGLAWTESVRSTLPATETPMVYGEGYKPETHCYNCGEPKPKPKSATNCQLCDAELIAD
jgi:hypothetical protein